MIAHKRPQILTTDVKMFFCKYNDPVYVKLEKITLMVMLCSERNCDQVLQEFKDYAQVSILPLLFCCISICFSNFGLVSIR